MSAGDAPAPRLVEVRPVAARTRPGEAARVGCRFAGGRDGARGELCVQAVDLTRNVAEVRRSVTVGAGGVTVEVDLDLPAEGPRGYHVQASFTPVRAGARSVARGAVLVVSHWREAPRMGFLSEFGPDEAHPDRVATLAGFHLTVVQFYDWMYRHYRFLPPTERYEDGMGRACSLDTVRARIEAVQARGMAALAYGAVYGAEREYAEAHPEQVLRDAEGEPHALIDRFFITDPRPGPWREALLTEYASTIRELGFDAIHMDQYGAPKRAFDADGAPVDLAEAFPGLVDEAAARVAGVRPDAAVTFNAVNDWPSGAVAASDQAIVYVEVWPPHDRYRHLVDLVHRGRAASGGKQVVLAAYLRPFRDGGAEADRAAALATAVIAASGGHHLLLGEGDGVLRDPYYPNHGRLSAPGFARMRRYYDHTAALHAYLFDSRAVDRSLTFANGENAELTLVGAPAASEPRAGYVWTAVWERPDGSLVLHLVNLVGAEHDLWNAPQREADGPLRELVLDVGTLFRAPCATWISPDDARGPIALARDEGHAFGLPELETWATIVVREGAP